MAFSYEDIWAPNESGGATLAEDECHEDHEQLSTPANQIKRIFLTDGDRLALVQLCIENQLEYLHGKKETFWETVRELLQLRLGRAPRDTRDTMKTLLNNLKKEENNKKRKSSAMQIDSELKQALKQWREIVEAAKTERQLTRSERPPVASNIQATAGRETLHAAKKQKQVIESPTAADIGSSSDTASENSFGDLIRTPFEEPLPPTEKDIPKRLLDSGIGRIANAVENMTEKTCSSFDRLMAIFASAVAAGASVQSTEAQLFRLERDVEELKEQAQLQTTYLRQILAALNQGDYEGSERPAKRLALDRNA